jgi:hypothetical protein
LLCPITFLVPIKWELKVLSCSGTYL